MSAAEADPVGLARAVLAGEPAWLVGGAVRDRLLGRTTTDLDLAVAGDPQDAARRLARAARGTAFELSGTHGAWRVVRRDRPGHLDLLALQGEAIEADLARRDFTVNAMAEPLHGGPLVDPFGGRADLAARRLRMVAARAFSDDPLRVLRLARIACELDLEPDPLSSRAAAARARGLAAVAPERVFGEVKRILSADRAVAGLELAEDVGAAQVVLPELSALHGVEQNVYHHRDVHGHTLEVLQALIDLQADPGRYLGDQGPGVAALMAEPLADELTRGQALRFAALLHDTAKPVTRAVTPEGRVTFIGHDVAGAELARAVLTRLRAAEKLRAFVAAVTLHHLRLGFLVHRQPLDRRGLYRYLRATDRVAVDVTVLTVADRLATRGRKAQEAIDRHLELARRVLGAALPWHAGRRPRSPVRGDELARELGLRGPDIGRVLAALEEASYAGEIATREEALTRARALADT